MQPGNMLGVHQRPRRLAVAAATSAFALAASVVAACGSSGRGAAAPTAGAPTTTVATPPPTTAVAPPAAPPTTAAPPPPAVAAPSPGSPCNATGVPPATYDHVVWIWMENQSFASVMSSSAALFTRDLASRCGLATNYRGVTHPSLPNYLAAAGGSTFGVSDDADPARHPIGAPSIFSQLVAAGREWRTYAETMPAPCTLTAAGRYGVKHNPAAYFTTVRDDCRRWNVPLGAFDGGALRTDLDTAKLPALSVIVPDICNDTHDCPVATGDAWLRQWVSAILDSSTYRAGRTALFLTYDEGDGADERVPTVVVAPAVPSGTSVDTALDHYSLLATTEQLLGLPTDLGAAATAPSMRSPFHL